MERIKLEELKPAKGSTHKIKKVGRGRASGHGKTSTHGNNGEGQRSGQSRKIGFEGGQMPAYRQTPKLKGFPLVNQLKYTEINVSKLNELEETVVDLNTLIALGLANKNSDGLRVLGNGEISKAVTVKAAHFTASAKEKIEAAGGKAELA